MAHREVPTFDGTPTLTTAKVEILKMWLASSMGDEDVATEPELNAYYEGQAVMAHAVLDLLYNFNPDDLTVPADDNDDRGYDLREDTDFYNDYED